MTHRGSGGSRIRTRWFRITCSAVELQSHVGPSGIQAVSCRPYGGLRVRPEGLDPLPNGDGGTRTLECLLAKQVQSPLCHAPYFSNLLSFTSDLSRATYNVLEYFASKRTSFVFTARSIATNVMSFVSMLTPEASTGLILCKQSSCCIHNSNSK